MPLKTLIFIPTYCERANAPAMFEAIYQSGLNADILFMDDNSPDGTFEALEALRDHCPRLILQRRSGKLGIGSAHLDAIQWAYDHRYDLLVTMDCDFTHSPEDIPKLITAAEKSSLILGSRWMKANSLPGWNLYRRLMTFLGHLLTRFVLNLPYDASSAFRAYRLDKIPRDFFELIHSKDYAFFFESLFILNRNKIDISEVPIVLPARTYGNSKMTARSVANSVREVFHIFFQNLRRPEQFLQRHRAIAIDPSLIDPQTWDNYWNRSITRNAAIYDVIATIYRQAIIKPNLERVICKEFAKNSRLLHAGCGSGQVDTWLGTEMQISAIDISPEALHLYDKNNPAAADIRHGSILRLPYKKHSFDGVYNMGVVEHFTEHELNIIFREFNQVLKLNGKLVIFWPHRRATSVMVLGAANFILTKLLKKPEPLHPAEVTLLKSRKDAEAILAKAGFDIMDYKFNGRDGFVQAVVIAKKIRNSLNDLSISHL